MKKLNINQFVWGHRKDINEYYEIKPEIFDRMKELKKEGLSEADILKKLGRETQLTNDLLKFLLKGKAKNNQKHNYCWKYTQTLCNANSPKR